MDAVFRSLKQAPCAGHVTPPTGRSEPTQTPVWPGARAGCDYAHDLRVNSKDYNGGFLCKNV